jgi:hypothetical protein
MNNHSAALAPELEAAQAGGSDPRGAAAAGGHAAAVSPSSYADAAFHTLHQALRAAQACEGGPLLDSLATALQRLSRHCHVQAAQLTSIAFEEGAHPWARLQLAMECQRAQAVAHAADAVLNFVQGRALGELDQSALNDSWLRVWGVVAPLPGHPSSN